MLDIHREGFHVVYILGSGHCGSTLLDMLLNGHSRIAALGEVAQIGRAPIAGPFWTEVARSVEASTGIRLDQIDLKSPHQKVNGKKGWEAAARWEDVNRAIFAAASETGDRPMLTDASNNPRRLKLLLEADLFPISVLHLVRDGRGVLNSYFRKYGSFYIGFRRWALPAVWAFTLRRRFPRVPWLRVRYEDLATQPESYVRRICAFLDLPFEPEMLVGFSRRTYAGMMGNLGTRALRQDVIALDERWRSELWWGHRAVFAVLGGWLNRLYGY